MLRDRRFLAIAACLAMAIGWYAWRGRVGLPPRPPAAKLPASARNLLPSERQDSVDLTVAPHQELDYRLGMQAGATLVYAWSTSHEGEMLPCEFPGQAATRAARGHGGFEAQSSGWYHWRWRNPGDRPVTIHVKLNGYYEPALPPAMPYDK